MVAEIFELVGLFEEDIGADRVSDMTARVIRNHLYDFTERVCRECGIPGETQEEGRTLPKNPFNSKGVILIPQEILRPLPIAHDWSDIDIVSAANQALRRRVNKIIGESWKHATTRVKRRS